MNPEIFSFFQELLPRKVILELQELSIIDRIYWIMLTNYCWPNVDPITGEMWECVNPRVTNDFWNMYCTQYLWVTLVLTALPVCILLFPTGKCWFLEKHENMSFFRKTIFLNFQKVKVKFTRLSYNFFPGKFRSFKTLWTFSEHFWTSRGDFILIWRRPPPKTRF